MHHSLRGEEAVGEVRHSATVPTRSAILGLLSAALGISRDEEEQLNKVNQHYHVAVHALASHDRWLRDYHTVSVPRKTKSTAITLVGMSFVLLPMKWEH
jgi:CRISPR system Cascade subunit CasD